MAQTKKSIELKEWFLYGVPEPLVNSEEVSTLVLQGDYTLMFEVDLLEQPGTPDQIRAWIDWGHHHNCTCHKLAAICFFEWTPEGKYNQVPMIDGVPSTNYIRLGELQEIMKLND